VWWVLGIYLLGLVVALAVCRNVKVAVAWPAAALAALWVLILIAIDIGGDR
jgi:hypothetical protein